MKRKKKSTSAEKDERNEWKEKPEREQDSGTY